MPSVGAGALGAGAIGGGICARLVGAGAVGGDAVGAAETPAINPQVKAISVSGSPRSGFLIVTAISQPDPPYHRSRGGPPSWRRTH
jgi:hypothetical protein